jgi:hypothetical protein
MRTEKFFIVLALLFGLNIQQVYAYQPEQKYCRGKENLLVKFSGLNVSRSDVREHNQKNKSRVESILVKEGWKTCATFSGMPDATLSVGLSEGMFAFEWAGATSYGSLGDLEKTLPDKL